MSTTDTFIFADDDSSADDKGGHNWINLVGISQDIARPMPASDPDPADVFMIDLGTGTDTGSVDAHRGHGIAGEWKIEEGEGDAPAPDHDDFLFG